MVVSLLDDMCHESVCDTMSDVGKKADRPTSTSIYGNSHFLDLLFVFVQDLSTSARPGLGFVVPKDQPMVSHDDPFRIFPDDIDMLGIVCYFFVVWPLDLSRWT